MDLEALPRSVAVVGASTNVDSPGHDYVRSLKEFGFPGEVYPINRKAEEVAGYRAYASLSDVPGHVDLVISCVPAEAVPDLVEECGGGKARFLHLFTARFAETGDEASPSSRSRSSPAPRPLACASWAPMAWASTTRRATSPSGPTSRALPATSLSSASPATTPSR
ncbi:MAG: CoA-binding protein [Dehalococcoidia bacterium]|nr:CoA-binding protein [Dehalococcoidia bacterium]